MSAEQSLSDEVEATLRRYITAFETDGTRDDLESFCQLPLAYVSDREVQLRDRYPFDPVKLRESTGLRRSNVELEVIHVDEHKAHVLIEGTREREDGTVIEHIESVYILHRVGTAWKISLMSGIRKPAPG